MDATRDIARTSIRDNDLAAARRLLADFRERLQVLDCDLRSLCAAMDGPTGAITELAGEVLDRHAEMASSTG